MPRRQVDLLHMKLDALSACADVLSELSSIEARKEVIACLLQLFVVSQRIVPTAKGGA